MDERPQGVVARGYDAGADATFLWVLAQRSE
jgi:hypothetical protein